MHTKRLLSFVSLFLLGQFAQIVLGSVSLPSKTRLIRNNKIMRTAAQFGEKSSLSLTYTIRPLYHGTTEALGLHVEVLICRPALKTGEVLLTTPIEIAKVNVGHFKDDKIVAHDGSGPLVLTREVEAFGPPIVNQNWRVSRPTNGTVTATYTALPRPVNSSTKNAPSFELRQNFGGLLGSGYGFLAVPPVVDTWETQHYNTTVCWNLTEAPTGTTAVWTWGEGQGPITRDIAVSEIAATYFMVGRIGSVTAEASGLYWLGTPPFNTTDIANRLLQSFRWMREFFNDDERTYRVFVRYNPFRGSMAGTALIRSFMFSYDDHDCAHPRTFEDYLLFLSHEMVHNWVNLGQSIDENWYPEGMAEYYSLLLTHRAGLLSADKLRLELNKRLTGYFTNPLVNASNTEVAKLTWKLSDAQRLPYGRGLVFALKVNALIRDSAKAEIAYSIDDVVLDLVERSRSGRSHGLPDYLDKLGSLVDGRAQAQDLYDAMVSGDPIIPAQDSLREFGFDLVREDAPIWELGFNESDAIQGDRVISGLVPGSAAEQAGLQNGDQILNELNLDQLKYDANGAMQLVVQRGKDHVLQFSFVPRGTRLLERWIYVNKSEAIEIEGMDEL